MFKNQAVMQVELNGATYPLPVPEGVTTLGLLHDILFTAKAMVLAQMAEQQKKEDAAKGDSKVEPITEAPKE